MSDTRKKTMMPFAFFEDKIIESEKAKISIAAHSVQYGTTCFSGMRGYLRGNEIRVFRVYDHYERLINAAKILGWDYQMEFEKFKKAIEALVKANKPKTDCYFRPFIYSEDEELTPKFKGISYDMAIYMIPLGDYLDTTRGLRLMVSSWRKFPDSSIPTKAKAGGSYLNSSLARTEAIRYGYDEALVMDDNWNIVEGSAENFIAVYRGEVIIPQIGSSMLEGITMRTVIDILKDQKIPFRFEKIDRSMLYTCDEILLTGTGAQILFAESVDDRLIGNKSMGKICKILKEEFAKIIEMQSPKSKEWITKVSI